jgi:hypothetical protein
MGYRPLSDSDTDIQPMIQLPDADKRKIVAHGVGFDSGSQKQTSWNLGGIT